MLLGLGMCRYPAAGCDRSGTAYTGRVAGDGVVWLWGRGLLLYHLDLGGVFLRQYRFESLLLARPPERPVHRPDDLGTLTRPTTARQRATAGALVRAAAGRTARYEHWVAETLGLAYREATLAARDKPPALPARDMARAWEHIAKKAFRLAPASRHGGARGALLAGPRTPAPLPVPALPWVRRESIRQQRYRTA